MFIPELNYPISKVEEALLHTSRSMAVLVWVFVALPSGVRDMLTRALSTHRFHEETDDHASLFAAVGTLDASIASVAQSRPTLR